MKITPLLLETHFFTKVLVEANPDYEPEESEKVSGEINADVQVGQNKEDPRRWRVILKIQTKDDKKIPYKIELNCVGLFSVDPEFEEGKMGQLVHANGAAILYSSAREFLLLITGRGPWDPFYLPTTNFLAPPRPKREDKSRSARPTTKVSKRERPSGSIDTHQTKEIKGKAQ